MIGLVEFLEACIAEDEAAAQAARDLGGVAICAEGFGDDGQMWTSVGVAYDPARVLAECEAKREIVTRLAPLLDMFSAESDRACSAEVELAWDVLEALVLPYADRPGYRQEWRP